MIAALVEKELRQHGSMLFLFWLLIAVGLFLLQANQLLSSIGGSGFYQVAWLLLTFFPLAVLMLGNAFIATDFRQKTQVFLEGLPLPRWKMVTVKYACGLAATVLTALMPLAITVASSWSAEAMNRDFLTLILSKTLLWAWFCWAVIFPFSLLGRYRTIIGLIVVMGLLLAQDIGDVPVSRFGPFELIGERYAYERVVYPVEAMWITAALIAGLTVLGYVMSLSRDATLASMLSEKMSTREKMTMIALALTCLMIAGSLIDRAQNTDALDLPDSIDLTDERGFVSIAAAVALPSQEEREAMQAHGQVTSSLLKEVAEYLHIEKLPPLYLVHRRDLKAGQYQDGELDSRQGYLLRLNVLRSPATDVDYQSYLIEKLLDAHQHYRLNSDSRGWVLQGFAYWWPRRTGSLWSTSLPWANTTAEPSASTGQLPALPSITADDINLWKRFRQGLPAAGHGWFAAQCIAALWTKDASDCRAFLSAVLGYSPPHDVRATLHDWWFSTPRLLSLNHQMDLQQLAQLWNAAVASSTRSAEQK